MTRRARTIAAIAAAITAGITAMPHLAQSRAGAITPLWQPTIGDYTYAPAAISVPGVDASFTCSNRTQRVVEDVVMARDHITSTDRVVLEPTPRAWDAKHVCDPTIVEGSYGYEGVTYRYVMFYTGSTDPSNIGYGNQIGVAFGNQLFGPWTKAPAPIVTARPGAGWGVGQPSAVALSDTQVLLAYTRSDPTTMFATVLDLSDAAAPVVVRQEWSLPVSGTPALLNGDIAYEPATDQIVIVLDGLAGLPAPAWLSNVVYVMRIPAADFYAGTGRWALVKTIDESQTGWEKHSNAGLVRTLKGTVDLSRLLVQITIAENSDDVLDTFRVIELWIGSSELGPATPVIPVQQLQPAVRLGPAAAP
jgi:hypothetical protein